MAVMALLVELQSPLVVAVIVLKVQMLDQMAVTVALARKALSTAIIILAAVVDRRIAQLLEAVELAVVVVLALQLVLLAQVIQVAMLGTMAETELSILVRILADQAEQILVAAVVRQTGLVVHQDRAALELLLSKYQIQSQHPSLAV